MEYLIFGKVRFKWGVIERKDLEKSKDGNKENGKSFMLLTEVLCTYIFLFSLLLHLDIRITIRSIRFSSTLSFKTFSFAFILRFPS